MGLTMTGDAEVSKPMRCNWCGRKTTKLVKIHSHEDKSTLRICKRHWLQLASRPRDWDLWVATAFPKWYRKVHHRDRETFLVEAQRFIKMEREIEKLFGESNNDGQHSTGNQ